MRIGAMFMVMPVIGVQQFVPARVRIGLTIALVWAIAPTLPPAPAVEPLSAAGLVITAQQLLLGVSMGLILQVAFSALSVAGQSISLTMGLGFSTFVDPVNGVSAPALSSFYTMIATLLFLSLNGHLVVLQVIASTFSTMPVAALGISTQSLMGIAVWGAQMFVGGMLIALPAMVTLLLINIAFGVVTRSAQQFNLLAVGFPTTMMAGFVILMITMPNLFPHVTNLLMQAFNVMRQVAAAGG